MKLPKRKAKRMSDRPTKSKVSERTNRKKYIPNSNQDIYAGSEEVMLNLVLEIIVKTIKKKIGL